MSDMCVALLRGINVGGKNKLPMKALVALFEDLGCTGVSTYIQSGNVVFQADGRTAADLAEAAREAIADRFRYDVPVVLRSAVELRHVVEGNPFLSEDPDPRHLHVGFLAEAPDLPEVESLDPARSSIDRFAVVDAEVYLHVPGGMGRTKLTTDFFERRLGTVMTARNWRTVMKLVEMADSAR